MNHDHSPSAPIVLSEGTALEIANSRKATSRKEATAVVDALILNPSDDDIARFETSVSNFLVSIGYRQAVHQQVPLTALKTQPMVDAGNDLPLSITASRKAVNSK